jgi:hypothetical protein
MLVTWERDGHGIHFDYDILPECLRAFAFGAGERYWCSSITLKMLVAHAFVSALRLWMLLVVIVVFGGFTSRYCCHNCNSAMYSKFLSCSEICFQRCIASFQVFKVYQYTITSSFQGI